MNGMAEQQHLVCRRAGVQHFASAEHLKVGISTEALSGGRPLNGLRHPPEGDTSGWYIWAGNGDPSDDSAFFQPVHVSHLEEILPDVGPYLGLPPGWRFLLDSGYEDIWFDAKLLEV